MLPYLNANHAEGQVNISFVELYLYTFVKMWQNAIL